MLRLGPFVAVATQRVKGSFRIFKTPYSEKGLPSLPLNATTLPAAFNHMRCG
jgi:hypothetical protein